MSDGTDAMLYVLFGIPALFVGLYLLAMGPVGWLVVAALGLAIVAARTWVDDDETGSPERTNCPDCGAPNPVDADTCQYCEASLPGA